MNRRFDILFFTLCICSYLIPSTARTQTENSWKFYDDSEVAIVEISMNPQDLEWMYRDENVESDSHHVATVRFRNAVVDTTIDSVGIRLRGKTTRVVNKKSFKLSFNTFKHGREIFDLEKINLNGEHHDPSIIRSKLCWDIFREVSNHTSRASHAAVYINNKYYGLYSNIEHIDEEFIDKNFKDDSGNLWKCLMPADLAYRGENPDNYIFSVDGQLIYDLKTNVDEYDYSKLSRFISIINNTSGAEFQDSIEKILDISSVLKYFSTNILTGSWDDYWFLANNYYLYHEPSTDLIHLIPFDYTDTFGMDWFGIDWSTVDPYEFAIYNNGTRPLVNSLLSIPAYKNLYTHFLEFVNNNVYKTLLIDDHIFRIKEMITPYAEIDTFRTKDFGFTMEDFNNSYGYNYQNRHIKFGLREFINNRYNSLNTQLTYDNASPAVYSFDYSPKNPGDTDSIQVKLSTFGYPAINEINIKLQRSDSPDIKTYPMEYRPVGGTTKIEETDRWTGIIPPLGFAASGKFRIEISNGFGDPVIYPRDRWIDLSTGEPPTHELLINEILARNVSTLADDSLEYDDWIEILNPTDDPVNLLGMHLTDTKSNLTKWQFSEDLILDPGELIVVWCDEDGSQGPLHTNFKLNGDGEFIAIVDSTGSNYIDSLTYPVQTADISYGREFENTDVWGFMNPSPGANNPLTGVEEPSIIPKDFTVTAYPNPFNPSTNFVIQVNRHGKISVEIFNILGQKVWSEDLGWKSPGKYEVRWNGVNSGTERLSSGIYIAQVKSENKVLPLKIMLVK